MLTVVKHTIGASVTFVATVFLAGCTSVVRPHVMEAEFLTSAPKLNGQVHLWVTDEFRTHRESKGDPMDLKKWEFDLGPLAVDTFKYALASRFEVVSVKLGKPIFPLPRDNATDLVIAVEPEFAGFSVGTPLLFKFETYTLECSFHVKSYDHSGNVLLEGTYEGVGKKQGAIGTTSAGLHALPVAAQLAVKDAVNKAVADIVDRIQQKSL